MRLLISASSPHVAFLVPACLDLGEKFLLDATAYDGHGHDGLSVTQRLVGLDKADLLSCDIDRNDIVEVIGGEEVRNRSTFQSLLGQPPC